jgi:hypothetical protein
VRKRRSGTGGLEQERISWGPLEDKEGDVVLVQRVGEEEP